MKVFLIKLLFTLTILNYISCGIDTYDRINITANGALCLDGSPAAIFF